MLNIKIQINKHQVLSDKLNYRKNRYNVVPAKIHHRKIEDHTKS